MASAFSFSLASTGATARSRARRAAPTARADRVWQARAAPEDAIATPAAPAALPLTSTPTCQRQLQLFYQPQVLASSTRMVLATTRRSMSASRSASRSTASVLIRPYTRIELVAARCTSARCCLLLLTAGLLMTSLMLSLYSSAGLVSHTSQYVKRERELGSRAQETAIKRVGGRSSTGLRPLAWVSPTPLGG